MARCSTGTLEATSGTWGLGVSGCSLGEDGLDQASPPASALTLKELLFFLHMAVAITSLHESHQHGESAKLWYGDDVVYLTMIAK